MITQEYLKSIFDYDPHTGVFTWKHREDASPQRNARRAGKPAGAKHGQYVRLDIDGERILGHRVAWCYMTGRWPEYQIDHINGIPSDNRFCNLREATRKENSRNRKLSVLSESGLKGVTFRAERMKWVARIQIDKRRINLGLYATRQQAHAAYTRAAMRYHGEFASVRT